MAVICLDTNYLIRALVSGTPEAAQIEIWLQRGQPLAAPAVVWYEFVCGPVQAAHIEVMRQVLTAGVLSFDTREAEVAGHLFNEAGRMRCHRVDAMIAATAICADAPLATANVADFEAFADWGLTIVAPA